jgi:hypothetical protein
MEVADSCQGSMRTAFEELAGYHESLIKEMEKIVSKQFSVSQVFCINRKITMFIQNIGTDTIKKNEFTIKVDDVDASSGLESDIEVYKTAKFSWNCGGECSSGEHNIYLETVSMDTTSYVMCS